MKSGDVEINMSDVFLPTEKVISREIEGELIIVPIESGIADFEDALYSFNATGRRLWELLSSKNDIQTICTQLSQEYAAPFETIKADILGLIKKLYQMGIIERRGV